MQQNRRIRCHELLQMPRAVYSRTVSGRPRHDEGDSRVEMCELWRDGGQSPGAVEVADGTSSDVTERTWIVSHMLKRKTKEHVIWMTRRMPVTVLTRLRVLAAQTSPRVPLWKIHQLALERGLRTLERRKR